MGSGTPTDARHLPRKQSPESLPGVFGIRNVRMGEWVNDERVGGAPRNPVRGQLSAHRDGSDPRGRDIAQSAQIRNVRLK